MTGMRGRQKYLRGLGDLRTLSGLGSRKLAPHTAYMKITSLELQKLRLSRVRDNAVQRIAEIDVRCAEIQKEKAALLAAIDGIGPADTPSVETGERPKGANVRRAGALSIRY